MFRGTRKFVAYRPVGNKRVRSRMVSEMRVENASKLEREAARRGLVASAAGRFYASGWRKSR